MQATFTLTFNFAPAPQPIGITNSSFTGTEGQAFTGTIAPITGGTPPFTVAGDLSALGLAIDAQGNITGTPTVSGAQTATVTVTDSGA